MHGFEDPALTVALAMLLGILSQGIARHLKVPGIVALLLAGVALGPDGANVIRPATLGTGFSTIVNFAVAVILFEGGLQLNIGQLRKQAMVLRRLVSIGAVVTAAGGAAAAALMLGWPWDRAALFGTLVIVTGPTVINPLLARIRLLSRPATILEAEGIFIDAVGATIAAVTLEVVLAPKTEAWAVAGLDLLQRLGTGALVGAVGGGLLALLIRWPRVVPIGLQNVVGLAFAMAVFQVAQAISHESGVTAAIVAGMVVGNARGHHLEELVEFKEQLTVLLIAMLFVLLSADVRIADVVDLGLPAVGVLVALMVVVRPLTVFIGSIGTELSTRERLFLSWLAPRGIVAAAMASLFAVRMAEAGVPGGTELRAMVFLVIAGTVTIQGLTSGPFAQFLGVRRPADSGFVILGANPLALALAERLKTHHAVAVVDSNPESARKAESRGIRVVFGNALEERTLRRAGIDGSARVIVLSPDEQANFLVAKKVKDVARESEVFVALENGPSGVTPAMVEAQGCHLAFGRARGLRPLIRALANDAADVRRFQLEASEAEPTDLERAPDGLLAMLRERGAALEVVGDSSPFEEGDVATFAVVRAHSEAVVAFLNGHGWSEVL